MSNRPWPQIPQTCATCANNMAQMRGSCKAGHPEYWVLGRNEPHGCPAFAPFWRELAWDYEANPVQLTFV